MSGHSKPNLWIFSTEPLNTRYTGQWFTHVPELLTEQCPGFVVRQVNGTQRESVVTPGAFLNFADTNSWKSSQLYNFLDLHAAGQTTPDDVFLFTDAWNTSVLQLRYIRDLMGLNWKLHGLWHAGSWDPEDFLGRIRQNEWIRPTEIGMSRAYDCNWFATQYHMDIFEEYLGSGSRNRLTGWPMEYMAETLEPYRGTPKTNTIVFPHRIAPEKQVAIFRDLATHLPEYEFVVCQDTRLTKDEYHKLLARSKILFSANLQETLGITTCAEGPLLDVIPMAPARLSYAEIFASYPTLLYNSKRTENWDLYLENRDDLIRLIRYIMNNHSEYVLYTRDYVKNSYHNFFSADKLIEGINGN